LIQEEFKSSIGQEAFKLHNSRGIKVGFIFPEENHWVLKPQMPKFGKRIQMAERNLDLKRT
jgi:hypothetical protein